MFAPRPESQMRLYELTFACRIYRALTGYDSSLASLRKATTVGAGRRNAMVGDVVPKSELKRWLNDCHSDGFIDKPDAARGLSSHLLRGRPSGRLTVAVGGDARPETAINALLDLLAWHWIEREGRPMQSTCWSATVPTRARSSARCGRWPRHTLAGQTSTCILSRGLARHCSAKKPTCQFPRSNRAAAPPLGRVISATGGTPSLPASRPSLSMPSVMNARACIRHCPKGRPMGSGRCASTVCR